MRTFSCKARDMLRDPIIFDDYVRFISEKIDVMLAHELELAINGTEEVEEVYTDINEELCL